MKTKNFIISLAIIVIASNTAFAQSPNFDGVFSRKDSIIKLNGTILVDKNSRIEIYAGTGAVMFDIYKGMDSIRTTSLVVHWGVTDSIREIYFYRRGETAFWMTNDKINGYYKTCNDPKGKFIVLDGKKCVPLSKEEKEEFNQMVNLLIGTVDELTKKPSKKQ